MNLIPNWAEICNVKVLFAQLFGFIPMTLAYFVFMFNDRRKVISIKACSDFLWSIHFILLNEMSGAFVNGINVVRNIIFFQKQKWNLGIVVPVIFCIITVLCTILSGDGLKCIFPLTGSCFAIFGFWCTKPENIRKFNLPDVILWLIYGIITGSISTIISNGFSCASILTAELKSK